jgi:hypothetical protein
MCTYIVEYRSVAKNDSVNNSRWYGEPAAYACAVKSHSNRRGDAGGVFCRYTPRLYDSTDRVSVERVSVMLLKVHLLSVKQRSTGAE